jgi:hypothetical protein
MGTIHVFISTGRFRSMEELRAFINPTYKEDGEQVPSAFMREVQFLRCDPDFIEAFHREGPVPLPELLAGTSWADQWLSQLGGGRLADAAVCVFGLNRMGRPEDSSLEYCGAFGYRILTPQEVVERQCAVHARRAAAESDKNGCLVILLCLFFGMFGVHRLYVGKLGTGILQLATLGGLGVWWWRDLQAIYHGTFTDVYGKWIVIRE